MTTIVPVRTRAQRKLFHRVTDRIYHDDPLWIPYVEADIEHILSEKNPLVQAGGRFERWLALQDNEPVGRIAAFIHPKRPGIGGIGFWETINDPAINHQLFLTAENWLRQQGAVRVEAPINFGDRGSYWGLRIEGTTPPTFQENYQPPYYRPLIESEGYTDLFRQFTYQISKKTFNADRLLRVGKALIQRGHPFQYRPLSFDDVERFARAAATIYNEGWQHLEGFAPISPAQTRALLEQIRPILIPDLIWFAFDDDRPVGMIVMIPDFNLYLKKIGGRLRWWNKWLLPLLFRTYTPSRLKGLVFGVVPDYHNRGVDVMLVYHFYHAIMRYPKILDAELAWIGNFNPRMQRFMENIHSTVAKVHATYQKVFEPAK